MSVFETVNSVFRGLLNGFSFISLEILRNKTTFASIMKRLCQTQKSTTVRLFTIQHVLSKAFFDRRNDVHKFFLGGCKLVRGLNLFTLGIRSKNWYPGM